MFDLTKSKELLDSYVQDLDSKLETIAEENEKRYLTELVGFIEIKEKELNSILVNLSEKSSQIGQREREMIELK